MQAKTNTLEGAIQELPVEGLLRCLQRSAGWVPRLGQVGQVQYPHGIVFGFTSGQKVHLVRWGRWDNNRLSKIFIKILRSTFSKEIGQKLAHFNVSFPSLWIRVIQACRAPRVSSSPSGASCKPKQRVEQEAPKMCCSIIEKAIRAWGSSCFHPFQIGDVVIDESRSSVGLSR